MSATFPAPLLHLKEYSHEEMDRLREEFLRAMNGRRGGLITLPMGFTWKVLFDLAHKTNANYFRGYPAGSLRCHSVDRLRDGWRVNLEWDPTIDARADFVLAIRDGTAERLQPIPGTGLKAVEFPEMAGIEYVVCPKPQADDPPYLSYAERAALAAAERDEFEVDAPHFTPSKEPIDATRRTS